MRQRHAAYFLAFAEQAEPKLRSGEQMEWLERLDAEYDNMRAVLEWSNSPGGDVALGLRLAGALWYFWMQRGYFNEARRWLAGPAVQSSSVPVRVRAKALTEAAFVADYIGEGARIRPLALEGLTLARTTGDCWLIAFAGMLVEEQQQDAIAIARQEGDPWLIAFTLLYSGNAAWLRND